MDETISGIEKLVGFIYRILFTIIPAGAFLCVSYLFFIQYYPDEIIPFFSQFSNLNNFWQVLLPLCLVFSLSLIVESFDLILFYYIMDFGNLTLLRLFGEGEMGKTDIKELKKLRNNDFYMLYSNTDTDTYIRKFINHGHFTLGLINSLINHPRVFNHIYYQLGREFAFNNLTVVVLFITNLYIPYVIAKFDIASFSNTFIYFQILQPIISLAYLIISYYLLRNYNAFKCRENKPDFNWKNILVFPFSFFLLLGISIIFSSIFFQIAFKEHSSFWLFAATNFLIFPLLISMVFKGFKEYLQVEKYYLSYFIEKYFHKDKSQTCV